MTGDVEIICRGCGQLVERASRKWSEKPQVATYCVTCVQAGRCPCYGRPHWHRFGHKVPTGG